MKILTEKNWQERTDAALAWILRSIEVCGGRGSSHSFSPIFGWRAAYPETTGYLLETLFDYSILKQRPDLQQVALHCADWLCDIQLENGAFTGSTAEHRKPSVFNTAQILFGLTASLQRLQGLKPLPLLASSPTTFFSTNQVVGEDANNGKVVGNNSIFEKNLSEKCLGAARRATDWLLKIQEPDGSWRRAAYVPGYVPAYYTRAVWGVLEANKVLKNNELESVMCRALHFYAGFFNEKNTIENWGFRPGEAAFTHTIAYTLEGFLECSILLDEPEILKKIIACAEALLAARTRDGRTAGRYDANLRGDFSFRCLTGQAQLSLVFQRIFEITGEPKFSAAAISFLEEALPFQNFSKNKNLHGAMPGSWPVWGPYLRFRYPNWGVKFLLDALKKVGK